MRVVMVAAVLAASGCVVQSQGGEGGTGVGAPGGIDVSWAVGASGCVAAGVETVRISGDGVMTEVPCGDGAVSIDADPGIVDLVFDGLDVDGRPRYQAQADDVRVNSGEVTTLPTVVLAALPANITVIWYFENGRLCGANGIDDLDVTLYDDDNIVETLTTPCDDGIEEVPSVQSGTYTLAVFGRDDQGVIKFGAEQDLVLDKGDSSTVEVMLTDW